MLYIATMKSKSKSGLVPVQIKMRPATFKLVKEQADRRAVSITDIVHLSLEAGLPKVIEGFQVMGIGADAPTAKAA